MNGHVEITLFNIIKTSVMNKGGHSVINWR